MGRRGWPDGYLCSALENLDYLNDWGYLDPTESYDAESANALLETGVECVKALTRLLDDSSAATLFGSESATLSAKYKYRRKDFAFRYIKIILGEAPSFLRNPLERDEEILKLKERLQKGN